MCGKKPTNVLASYLEDSGVSGGDGRLQSAPVNRPASLAYIVATSPSAAEVQYQGKAMSQCTPGSRSLQLGLTAMQTMSCHKQCHGNVSIDGINYNHVHGHWWDYHLLLLDHL